MWVTVWFFCVPCRTTPWSRKPIADANVMASLALTMCRLPATGEVLTLPSAISGPKVVHVPPGDCIPAGTRARCGWTSAG